MEFLRELLTEANKKKSLKKAAAAVYSRDYKKTKNKEYRKYDPKKYQHSKGSE